MLDRVTLPLNLARRGPTLALTTAVISVSEVLSTDSQPAMQARSTSGSLSASHTFCWGAGMRYSPVRSMAVLPTAGKDARTY